MTPIDLDLPSLSGGTLAASTFDGLAVLVVNVASKCGLTPQYEGLERLQKCYGDRGFTVLGVPTSQFADQEPGTSEEIQVFCSTTYGITFPMTDKLQVNGQRQHPLYQRLTATPDGEGVAGEVEWNFEKFLIAPDGEVTARFRPGEDPESEAMIAAIEDVLS